MVTPTSLEAVGAGIAILPPNEPNGPLIPTSSRVSSHHETHPTDSKTEKDVEADLSLPILSSTLPKTLSKMQLVVVAALVTFTLCMSSAGAMTLTIALPTIRDDLNMNENDLQWVAAAYSLTNGCFLLLSGRLADVHGRKRMFLVSQLKRESWLMTGGINVERALDTDWRIHDYRCWSCGHPSIGWYGCRDEVSFVLPYQPRTLMIQYTQCYWDHSDLLSRSCQEYSLRLLLSRRAGRSRSGFGTRWIVECLFTVSHNFTIMRAFTKTIGIHGKPVYGSSQL
jgi:hypothetical protein